MHHGKDTFMKEKNICYIIGAGEFYDHKLNPDSGDFVIAADGGYTYLRSNGVRTDVIIGDFDSLPDLPPHQNIVKLNREKDDTDMLAALKLGMKQGYKSFHIYGGTGGRIDHTIANIQSLAFLSQSGAQGFLHTKDTVITAITNGRMDFHNELSGYVSVFAHGRIARGVYIKGLKYELSDMELSDAFPLGVSNELIGIESSITVLDGTLIIVYPQKIEREY